jgi:hypothetical protein
MSEATIQPYINRTFDLERERDEARAHAAFARSEGVGLRALLRECQSHILAAGHLSPRCEYHGVCRCDRDDLLQRIDAALGDGE